MPADAVSPVSAFGQVLRAGRLRAGLTQEELAARISIGQTTLSAYERGENEPTLGTAVLIAEIVGLDITDLAAPFRTPARRRRRELAQVAS